MFKLTNEQYNAIKLAIEWYYNPHKKPAFFLCGSAGTGKSTVAKTAVSMMGLSPYQVLFVTFTGKAASVLRAKGNVANTIHSTFYRVFSFPDGRTGFAKRKSIPTTIKLVVVDEVSMVNEHMMTDLKSFGVPLFCLGDPGQLPALFYPNLGVENPDVFLTEVIRQKADSGVLMLAIMVREGKHIDFGQYKESKVIHMDEISNIEKYDMVLCWSNKTRKEINSLIRKKKGYNSVYPKHGEKLVCLKNNYTYEISSNGLDLVPVNGMEMKALSDAKFSSNEEFLIMDYAPDYIKDKNFSSPVSKIPFEAYKNMEPYEDRMQYIPNYQVVLDFGYCLTVHKSQGSAWANVLIIDEYGGPKADYKKWLYTGITRTTTSITIARAI